MRMEKCTFCENSNNFFFWGGGFGSGGGIGGSGWGARVMGTENLRGVWSGRGGRRVGGVRVDVNGEEKFL